MVSPSKKLQASAPFSVPEANANFQLAVVQPSGWEMQTPGFDEDEVDEARSYESNVATPVNYVSPLPQSQQVRVDAQQAQTGSSTSALNPASDSRFMASAFPPRPANGITTFHPTQGYRPTIHQPRHKPPTLSANGNHTNDVAPPAKDTRDDSSAANSNTPPPAQDPAPEAASPPAAEPRGEKRRQDEEEHEDEEAEEVEKAMVDEDADVEHSAQPGSRVSRNEAPSASATENRPAKKARVELTSADEDSSEDSSEEQQPRRSSRKSGTVVKSETGTASAGLSARRRGRPVSGVFVGSGRIVPIKDRPFGEATCHRCGNMKNQPACILHSGESRCDKCIVDAQGCWWRRGPNDYRSIAGTAPQKKLVDNRDEEDLKKKKEGNRQTGKASEKRRRVSSGKEMQGDQDSDIEEVADTKPLIRKSLRVTGSASKAAEPATPKSSALRRKSTRASTRSPNKPGPSSVSRRSSNRRKSDDARKKGKDKDEDESESESGSEDDDEGSESESDSSQSSRSPPPRKALKGTAARRERPGTNQQLKRWEKAEAKIRDELWALTWEKERLVKTEKRLQEELEEILTKKVEVGSGH